MAFMAKRQNPAEREKFCHTDFPDAGIHEIEVFMLPALPMRRR
jgi:hypothetical protein